LIHGPLYGRVNKIIDHVMSFLKNLVGWKRSSFPAGNRTSDRKGRFEGFLKNSFSLI
jgi:hypothetical protein